MNYELIDSGDGRRLERFGEFILDRPDPEVLWPKAKPGEWETADAVFNNKWHIKSSVPEKWEMEHSGVKFYCKLAPFKHTGVFPEQLSQWEEIEQRILKANKDVSVLNLFAYTGIASLFAAKAGAKVTHVDASKPAITWANENRQLNDPSWPIRWIVDDALKFTEREVKRGVKYDIILMDPPVYGHGPGGKPWDFSKDFPLLLKNVSQLISDDPLMLLINAYAISTSSITLANTVQGYFAKLGGQVTNGELTLKEASSGRLLSTGIWAKWNV